MNDKSNGENVNKLETSGEDAWLLALGIRSLLRCDDSEVVQGIARYVVSKYGSLRVGSQFIERRRETAIAPLAAYLGAATRFLEVREGGGREGAVWVARLDNERRAVEKLLALAPETNWTELPFRRKPDKAAIAALRRELFPLRRRIFKLARLLLRRGHKFFKVLRAVELIGYYVRYVDIFRKSNFTLAVVSSHSNPHGIAFNLAARRCGVPVVLVTHGMPVRPVARLSFNLGVVHCEAARRIYQAEGCRLEKVLIHGRRQDYAPMPENLPAGNLTVGIFLCKDVNEKRLNQLVEKLLAERRVSRVIVRPHPKNLFRKFDKWLASLGSPRVQKSSGDSVFADLKESDIVFGGNSSVLIEAVTAGKSAGFVGNLDYGEPDFHEFVRRGLIYPVDEKLKFDFDAMLRFYRRAEWLPILKFYADIDEDESTVALKIADALREIVERK